jgi:hypothetical protein
MTMGTVRGAVAAAALLPVWAFTQPPAESRHSVDVLMGEVRLLRRAIERQTSTAARAQLLVGRLALQEQRVARSSIMAERAEMQSTAAAELATRMQSELAVFQEALDDAATEPAPRAAAEQQVRALKARLAEHAAATTDVQARLQEAKQSLEADRARYDELEAAFNRLDRELEQQTSR